MAFSCYNDFTDNLFVHKRNKGLKCLTCPVVSKTLKSEDSSISPREEARGGAGGGSGSRSKSNLVTVESLEDNAIHQSSNQK